MKLACLGWQWQVPERRGSGTAPSYVPWCGVRVDCVCVAGGSLVWKGRRKKKLECLGPWPLPPTQACLLQVGRWNQP